MKRFLILALALLVLLTPAIAMAQDPAPAPEVEPAVNYLADLIAGVESFMVSSAVAIGLVAYIITQAGKWAIPGSSWFQTERIYAITASALTIVYVLANLSGYTTELQSGVDLLSVLADPLKIVLGLIFVPSAVYAGAKRVNNPIAGGKQGLEAFQLAA